MVNTDMLPRVVTGTPTFLVAQGTGAGTGPGCLTDSLPEVLLGHAGKLPFVLQAESQQVVQVRAVFATHPGGLSASTSFLPFLFFHCGEKLL